MANIKKPRLVRDSEVIRGAIKDVQKPEGTDEEMLEAWEKSSNYLYKILNFSPVKGNHITPKQLEYERRIFKFLRLGPRAGYLAHSPKSKLTSADVLYILSSACSTNKAMEMFNVSYETVNGIRRGIYKEWNWEYALIKRLKGLLVKSQEIELYSKKLKLYELKHFNDQNVLEHVCFTINKKRANILRKEFCPPEDFKRMVREKTLDIYWPIVIVTPI